MNNGTSRVHSGTVRQAINTCSSHLLQRENIRWEKLTTQFFQEDDEWKVLYFDVTLWTFIEYLLTRNSPWRKHTGPIAFGDL